MNGRWSPIEHQLLPLWLGNCAKRRGLDVASADIQSFSKCLDKIDFIFFSEIPYDSFHIGHEMFPADRGPKFYPRIFHQAPQDLNEGQFGRIFRQGEDVDALGFPCWDLLLKRLARMDGRIIHHEDGRSLDLCTKVIDASDHDVTGDGSCNARGFQCIVRMQKSHHIHPLTGRTFSGNRLTFCLPRRGNRGNETKTRCVHIPHIDDPVCRLGTSYLKGFPSCVIEVWIRVIRRFSPYATPALLYMLSHPFDRFLAYLASKFFINQGTNTIEMFGKLLSPLTYVLFLRGLKTWRASCAFFVM
jgi:hypothetical protein